MQPFRSLKNSTVEKDLDYQIEVLISYHLPDTHPPYPSLQSDNRCTSVCTAYDGYNIHACLSMIWQVYVHERKLYTTQCTCNVPPHNIHSIAFRDDRPRGELVLLFISASMAQCYSALRDSDRHCLLPILWMNINSILLDWSCLNVTYLNTHQNVEEN